MSITSQTTFKQRLAEALQAKGYFNRKEQLTKVSEGAGVTRKTASNYFNLDKCPMNKYPMRLMGLANSLECDAVWLYTGKGQSPMDKYVLGRVRELGELEKNAFLKGLLCLSSNDPKGCHTIELYLNRTISRDQFLTAI